MGWKKLIYLSILAWIVLFALEGMGIGGSSVKPIIAGIPFSIFYLFVLGVWGVVNVFLLVNYSFGAFYNKVKKLGLYESDKFKQKGAKR